MASTALRSRTISAPMPLGAPILWPESVSRVQGRSLHADGHLAERLHRVGVERHARGLDSARRSPRTGWMTPTSLFTHMTETTAGRSASARCPGRPGPLGRSSPPAARPRAPPRAQTACAAARIALCSIALTTAHIAAPWARGREARPDDPEVVRFGAAGGEDHLVRLGTDRVRRSPAGPARSPRAPPGRTGGRSRGCRSPARSGRGASPPAPPGAPGSWRRGRGRRMCACQNLLRTYMLCTPRETTSSTASVSWVKNGSPYRHRIREP